MIARNLTRSYIAALSHVRLKRSVHAGLTGLSGFAWATRTHTYKSPLCILSAFPKSILVRELQPMLTLLTLLNPSKHKGFTITGLLAATVTGCKGEDNGS